MSRSVEDSVRILHVDDDPDVSSLTTTFLEREHDGFETESQTDPISALDRLSSGGVDCVVSDYEMPGMSGIEFLEAVREDHPGLPFILFTGKGSEEVASEAISAGVTDYIQKDSRIEQFELLGNRIDDAVSKHRMEQRAQKRERAVSLLQRLNQAMVIATTREEIEQVVAETIAAEDEYLLAWIGEYDAEWDRVVPETVAGVGAEAVSPNRLSNEGEPVDGVVRGVVESREVMVVRERDPTLDVWNDEEIVCEYEAAVVLPVEYRDDWLGLLVVYVAEESVLDDAEFDMFEELAGDLGQALHTAETHRTLQRHRSAVEAIPEGVFVLDENATIELANEPAASLIDRTPAEVQGLPFPTFVEEGIVDGAVIEWYLETLRELLSSRSDREEAWYETEIRPMGGDPRTVEVHITLRPYDEEFRGTVGVLRDITERKRHQREFEESEERYRRLVEEAPVPIAMYGHDGRLVYVNEAAVSFMDATDQSDLLGQPALKFVHPDDRDVATQRMEQVLEERAPTPVTELTLVDRSWERKYVHLRGVPVTYAGEPAGQVVINDITEQKERERDLRRQRDHLDEFASVVSHDLRNPLQVIRGRLELAKAESPSPHIEAAMRAQERMDTLIEDILRFARMDEQALDGESLQLDAVAEEAWHNVPTGEATLVADGECLLHGDPSRVKELLENLFRNAIDHGDSSCTITVGPLADGAGFYVADDGPGISRDERGVVFEYGYSTDPAGSGFGLAIVKQIADLHGWDVSITESSEGGARFEFYEVATGHVEERSPGPREVR